MSVKEVGMVKGTFTALVVVFMVALQALAWAVGALVLWTALAFVVDLVNRGGIGNSFYAWTLF